MKRLRFDEHKLTDVVDGIRSLIGLEDPVGKIKLHTTLDDGLELYRVTSPIGVIGVIFESRPDALVQIATLCLKSGNAVFLKGGSEAANTNKVLAEIIYEAGVSAGLPEGFSGLYSDPHGYELSILPGCRQCSFTAHLLQQNEVSEGFHFREGKGRRDRQGPLYADC